jgi:hypothetical protein
MFWIRSSRVAVRNVAVLLVLLSLASPALALAAQEGLEWESVGPAGGSELPAASGVEPLSDGTLLLLRGESVLRRTPGGRWGEVLSGGRGTYLAANRGDRPLALAALGELVYLSLDGGLTWRQTNLPAEAPSLELSPGFDKDATALYRAGGRLLRTRDGGISWDPLTLPPGQRVQQAVFSPAFVRDQTVVAAVVSGDFPRLLVDSPPDQPASENETSAGVLISRDAGQSWHAPGPGPTVDGTPYRHVYALAISPTFGTDQTLLAYAWGPRSVAPFMGGGTARTWRGALLLSRDQGATWQVVQSSGPASFQRGYASLALSPAFELDQTIFLALSEAGASPASSSCRLLRSVDAGTSWDELMRRGSYESCLGVLVSPRYPDDRVVIAGKQHWMLSQNGGLTWDSLAPPSVTLVARPVFAPDWWLYAGGRDGAWRLAPFPDRDDLPPCTIIPAGGFGRLWRANDPLRGSLGCPRESERRLDVRLRPTDSGLYLRLATDDRTISLAADGSLRLVRPDEAPADGWQDQNLMVQSYEGGLLLWRLMEPASILAINLDDQRWRSFPDTH